MQWADPQQVRFPVVAAVQALLWYILGQTVLVMFDVVGKVHHTGAGQSAGAFLDGTKALHCTLACESS